MRSFGVSHYNKKVSWFIRSMGGAMSYKCLVILFVMPFLLGVTSIEAAQLIFEPNGVSVNADPGEVVTVPLSVTLSGDLSQNSYASFNLAQVGGNLNPGWIGSSLSFSLNSWYMTRQSILKIRVPDTADGGLYRGVFSPMVLRTSDPIDQVSFSINVNVNKLVTCNRVPEFSDIISSQDAILTRNNKQVPIDLSGSVLAQEGCTISNLWYQLADEYGELDHTENVIYADDGSFEVSIPMIASRKGDDKDGRLYTVLFKAENEVGEAESNETRVVVSHDNRKE